MSIVHTKYDPNLWFGRLTRIIRNPDSYSWTYKDETIKMVKELDDEEIKSLYAFLKRSHGTIRNTSIQALQRAQVPVGVLNPEQYLDSAEDTKTYVDSQNLLGEIQLAIQVIFTEGISRPSIEKIMRNCL